MPSQMLRIGKARCASSRSVFYFIGNEKFPIKQKRAYEMIFTITFHRLFALFTYLEIARNVVIFHQELLYQFLQSKTPVLLFFISFCEKVLSFLYGVLLARSPLPLFYRTLLHQTYAADLSALRLAWLALVPPM